MLLLPLLLLCQSQKELLQSENGAQRAESGATFLRSSLPALLLLPLSVNSFPFISSSVVLMFLFFLLEEKRSRDEK
jgi:hypothetical protein